MKRRIIALILGVSLLSDLFVTGFTSVSAEAGTDKSYVIFDANPHNVSEKAQAALNIQVKKHPAMYLNLTPSLTMTRL